MLCGKCADDFAAAGSPRDPDRVRYVFESSITGVPRWIGGQHHGMRLFLEIAGDDHSGRETRWSYSRALGEVKSRAWSDTTQYAPENRRELYATMARARLLRERRAADAEAKAATPGADIEW